MDLNGKIFYNQGSASKLGWEPSWFKASEFDEELITKIEKFQEEHDLTADGLCGPLTYRRLQTDREAAFEMRRPVGIVAHGEEVPIDWDKVVNLVDEGNLALPATCYRTVERKRNPTMIVTHWDAALSAKSCYKILRKREISSHFVIDNDGTIYQMVDTQNIGWHAGIRKVNNVSIGIDFSNAYYLKYQGYYRKRGFGNRPMLKNSKVHGRTLKPHLGYYPVQVEAYKALLKCLSAHYGIELKCPLEVGGRMLCGVSDEAAQGKFKGVVSHYHLTTRKIDCAGLEIGEIVEQIKEETNA